MDMSEKSKLFLEHCKNNTIDTISDFYDKYKNEIDEDDIFTGFYEASYRYNLDLMIWMYVNIPCINSEEKLCLGFYKFNKYIYDLEKSIEMYQKIFHNDEVEKKLKNEFSMLDFYYKIIINKHFDKNSKYYKYVNDSYNLKKLDKKWLKKISKNNNYKLAYIAKEKLRRSVYRPILHISIDTDDEDDDLEEYSSINFIRYKILYTEWFIKNGYKPDEDDYHFNNIQSNNIQSNNIQSNNIQSNNIQSNNLHSNNLQSNNLHSNNIQSNNLHSNNLQSNNLQSNNLHSNIYDLIYIN
jgi:hypothetical protein